MHIGGLRHRVTILEGHYEKDERLEEVLTFREWKPVWAGVYPEDGRVYYRAKQENAEVEGVIRMRWQPGLLKLSRECPLRVQLKGRVFDVLWVRDMEEKCEELRLAYKEIQV